MHASKLIGLNHDIFYGVCDACDLLVLLVVSKMN
jgi:hypothetical protein